MRRINYRALFNDLLKDAPHRKSNLKVMLWNKAEIKKMDDFFIDNFINEVMCYEPVEFRDNKNKEFVNQNLHAPTTKPNRPTKRPVGQAKILKCIKIMKEEQSFLAYQEVQRELSSLTAQDESMYQKELLQLYAALTKQRDNRNEDLNEMLAELKIMIKTKICGESSTGDNENIGKLYIDAMETKSKEEQMLAKQSEKQQLDRILKSLEPHMEAVKQKLKKGD